MGKRARGGQSIISAPNTGLTTVSSIDEGSDRAMFRTKVK
jgi:hypothetical protein